MDIIYGLSAIAFENRPRASGAAMRYITLSAPADSPAMVTLDGLPPKAPGRIDICIFQAGYELVK